MVTFKTGMVWFVRVDRFELTRVVQKGLPAWGEALLPCYCACPCLLLGSSYQLLGLTHLDKYPALKDNSIAGCWKPSLG